MGQLRVHRSGWVEGLGRPGWVLPLSLTEKLPADILSTGYPSLALPEQICQISFGAFRDGL